MRRYIKDEIQIHSDDSDEEISLINNRLTYKSY